MGKKKQKQNSWVKGSLIGKKEERKKKKRIHKISDIQHNCSPPANWCSASPWAMVAPCPQATTPVLLLITMSYGMEYSFCCLGTCPGCVPSQLFVSPQPLCWQGIMRSWKVLFPVSTALQHLKHQCFITTIFIIYPKHSTLPASMKKMYSIPAETRTLYWRIKLRKKCNAKFCSDVSQAHRHFLFPFLYFKI